MLCTFNCALYHKIDKNLLSTNIDAVYDVLCFNFFMDKYCSSVCHFYSLKILKYTLLKLASSQQIITAYQKSKCSFPFSAKLSTSGNIFLPTDSTFPPCFKYEKIHQFSELAYASLYSVRIKHVRYNVINFSCIYPC